MLALIVALFWLAILAPWAIVKFRNSRAEKSIDSFHLEHERLSRQRYSVAPVHRLDEVYADGAYVDGAYADGGRHDEEYVDEGYVGDSARPRLTVVHDDDTYSTLESRASWDEWDRDYDYDHPRTLPSPARASQHRYTAYAAAVPFAGPTPYARALDVDSSVRASMRVRRHRIFVSLGLSALLTTGLNFVIALTLLQYLAVMSWAGLVAYVAAALVAVSQGYLEVSSLVGGNRPKIFAVRDERHATPYEESTPYDDDGDFDERDRYDQPYAPARRDRVPRRVALG
jgi:hypothetical protein